MPGHVGRAWSSAFQRLDHEAAHLIGPETRVHAQIGHAVGADEPFDGAFQPLRARLITLLERLLARVD